MSALKITRNLFSTSLPAILVYFSIMFISGCLAKAEKNSAATAPMIAPVPGVPVDGYIMKPAVLKDEIEITGTLKANQEVDIVSELPRKIIRVNVKDGATVQAGQLLFEMDNAALLAELEKLHE